MLYEKQAHNASNGTPAEIKIKQLNNVYEF